MIGSVRAAARMGAAWVVALVLIAAPAAAAQAETAPRPDPQAAGAPGDAGKEKASAGQCETAPPLLTSDSVLTTVAKAVKDERKLSILVIGTGSSVLSGPDGSGTAYPARLEAALRQYLPNVSVNVSADIQQKRTAEEILQTLPKLLAERRPTLAIWQTGTVDAMRAVGADAFTEALEQGIATIREAGADVVVMNMQYSPRTETVISLTPYMEAMRNTAQQKDVPLFDRFAIMHAWSESGAFDLYGAFHGLGLARRVHACLGQALAAFIVNAAQLVPAKSRASQ